MSSGLHMTVAKFDTSMCGLEEMCDKLNDYINEHLKRFVFVFRGYINRAGSLVIVPCLSCAEAKQLLELVETARSDLGVKESVFNVNHVSFGYPNSKDLVFNYEQSCRKTLTERSVFTKMYQANTRDSDTQNISKEVSNTEDSCMPKCMHSHRHAKR
jgi:hypothetical protein